jgi:hypothetical protein
MESFLFLSSVIAVAIIVHWLVTNESKGLGDKTVGLLAMREVPGQPDEPAEKAAAKPARRQRGS